MLLNSVEIVQNPVKFVNQNTLGGPGPFGHQICFYMRGKQNEIKTGTKGRLEDVATHLPLAMNGSSIGVDAAMTREAANNPVLLYKWSPVCATD